MDVLRAFAFKTGFSYQASTHGMTEQQFEMSHRSFYQLAEMCARKCFHPFPDKRVDEAYLHPEVDHDPSPFAWGVSNLDALRSFLMATIK